MLKPEGVIPNLVRDQHDSVEKQDDKQQSLLSS